MLRVGKFNVRVVLKGDKYGYQDSQTLTLDRPLVEFYDTRHMHTDRGQFVTRYFVETLLPNEYPNGLSLYGSEPSWDVSGPEMACVLAYLKGYLRV